MAICPSCGSLNQTGKFCTECGTRLELNVAVPAPQAPVAAEALAAGVAAAPVTQVMAEAADKVEQAFAEAKEGAAAAVAPVVNAVDLNPAPAPVAGSYPAVAAAPVVAAAPAAASEGFLSKIAKAADTASDKIQAAIDGNGDGTPRYTTEVPYSTTSTSARLGGEPTSTYHAPDPASLSGSYPSSPAGYTAPAPAAAPAAGTYAAPAAAPAASVGGTYPSSPAGYTASAYAPGAAAQPVAYTADGQPIMGAPAAKQGMSTGAKVAIGIAIALGALILLGVGVTACGACAMMFV